MLDLKEIKDLWDKSYTNNQVTRQRAADDTVFFHVTHWDSNTLEESQLAYRGEFDILKKAMTRIIGRLKANPVQIDFQPVDEDREDGADLLDGLYRADDRRNETVEAYGNGIQEAIVCGVGAWELYSKYETNRAGDENQVLRRRALYEANNTVFWDPNARMLDKSDADYVGVLKPYSPEGYKKLKFELTGEEDDDGYTSSFGAPEISYVFPWIGGQNDVVHVVSFFHRETVQDKVLTLEDPLGQPLKLRESDLKDVMDDLMDEGYKITGEKVIKRYEITRYIASGKEVIKHETVVGENIPIIPVYGKRAFVEDEEHYEGITRTAKDPQRLRNFQMSYLADIVSRSPRPKPIFTAEQIEGHQDMYELSGADNNLPYLLMNSKTANGEPLPIGPIAELPEQKVPQSLMLSMEATNQAISEIIDAGAPKDLADIDLSGKALRELNSMMDQSSMLYQENLKHAKRRDAEIYASMASIINDAPRKVNISLPDGSRKSVDIMQSVMDEKTGEMKILNDLTNTQFDVFAEISPSYTTKKEETFDQLGEMAVAVAATDPNLHNLLIMQQLTLMDGVALEDVRTYARNKLIVSGIKKPETKEEEELLIQSQNQPEQPDSSMVLAQAEQAKAQADMAEVERGVQNDIMDNQVARGKLELMRFDLSTKRIEAQTAVQEAQADIQFKRIDTMTKRLDAVSKFRANVNS